MDVTYDLNFTHNFLVRTSSMASVATVNGGRGGLEEGRLEVEEEGLLYFLEVAGLEQVRVGTHWTHHNMVQGYLPWVALIMLQQF